MITSAISKKRLLFVVPSLVGGGAERAVVRIINHLNKDKYDVLLVLFEDRLDYQKDVDPGTKILCLNKKNKWDFFKLIFKLRRIFHDYRPDVVISFIYYANVIAFMASVFLKRRFRLVISERDNPYKYLYLSSVRFKLFKKWMAKFVYNNVDNIIAVSEGVRKYLEKDFNIAYGRIKVIYNGIPLKKTAEMSQEEVEHPFFKNKDTQVIMSAGRLTEEKRFDRLIKAFSLVKEKQGDIYLIILGKGKLYRELKKLTEQLNIAESVDFVGFQANPYAWFSKADIFVLSSDSEGCPNVIIEAMACSIPVISTDCPFGPGEIIIDKKSGLLVPTMDEKKLAEAILLLSKDNDLKACFSREGKKRAEGFTVENMVSKYEGLF